MSGHVIVAAGIGVNDDGSGEPGEYWLLPALAEAPYDELPSIVEWEADADADPVGPYKTARTARAAATRRGWRIH
mgnify:FL=1